MHLEQTLANRVPGDVVDLGCNSGCSTVVMQRIVTEMAPDRHVRAYDSFQCLPDLSPEDRRDGVYAEGDMAVSVDEFTQKFESLGLTMPYMHKGWFEETVPRDLLDKICFALLDGDLYESNPAYPAVRVRANGSRCYRHAGG